MESKKQIDPHWYSFITVSWINPLIRLGKRRPLQASDLYELKNSDKAATIAIQFQSLWDDLFHNNSPRLLPLIFKLIWFPFFSTWFAMLVGESARLVAPLLIERFLIVLGTDVRSDIWFSPWFLSLLLFLSQVISVLMLSISKVTDRTIHQRIESLLIGAIYKKSILLSNKSKKQFTPGKILNLINDDVQEICESCQQMYLVIMIPFQLCLIFHFLNRLIGQTLWIAVGVVGCVSLVTSMLSPIISRYAGEMAQLGDVRIGLVREMLMGIKAIKLQTSESVFLENISNTRKKQMGFLVKLYLDL